MRYLTLQLPDINGSSNSINVTIVPTGGPGTLDTIIGTGLSLAVVAAIVVCLFMLILSGFEWIFSEGDKQKVAKARQRLAMSIIGLIVVFVSFMIINIIYTFFFGQTFNFLAGQQH
jgi:uncharacterized membrane protein